MKFGANLKKRIKNLVKRSQFIVRLYRPIKFLYIVSGKDLLNVGKDIRKTRLMLTIRPYTMMDYPPLSTLYESACRFERAKMSGSFVECGVRNGDSAAVIASAAKKNINRHVWLFDSWEGFPEPDERDTTQDMKRAKKGGCLGFEETVRELLFNRLQLDSTRVHLVKGWFTDTLPMKEIGPIALLHLDCDLYESVRFCLEQLYDDIINGGCIFIDDYRNYKGCKEAVNEFINRRNLKVEMIEYGGYGAYFRKES
jgi:hypothetical protein